jgi:hypothetical protein
VRSTELRVVSLGDDVPLPSQNASHHGVRMDATASSLRDANRTIQETTILLGDASRHFAS